jgi:hypothetical protein
LAELSKPTKVLVPLPDDMYEKPFQIGRKAFFINIHHVIAQALLNVSNTEKFAFQPNINFVRTSTQRF